MRGEPTAPRPNRTGELAALWAELADRCRGSQDPELRSRLAHAWGNEALLWLQDGREHVARRRLAEIVEEFGAEPPGLHPELDLWVSRARHADTVLDLFEVGEPELELTYLKRQRHWDRRRRLKDVVAWLRAGAPRNHMARLVRHARETHRWSAGAVRSWLVTGEPFVLLLRNFALTEQSGIATGPVLFRDPGDVAADHVQVIDFKDGAPALNELAAGVPLVHVASTSAAELEVDPLPGQFGSLNRLYLPDATWFETVSTLIGVADQVIVWADRLSPGLARELECLTEAGRTGDTLVVLEEPTLDIFSVLPPAEGEQLTPAHPALAAFPHVVEAAELKDRRVNRCPALMRVVERLTAARDTPIDERLAEIASRLRARTGPSH